MFRKKDINKVKNESSAYTGLEKNLTSIDLILLGIGAVIGTGIFVLVGPASQYSGPALPVSMLLGGIICLFVALVYTEIASMIPTSGSIYTYAYVALGEVMAWIAGMLLLVEFTLGASAVASGWSAYVSVFIKNIFPNLSDKFFLVPSQGGFINLPASIFTLLLTFLSIRGSRDNALLNSILVIIKLSVILFFIILALPYFDKKNWVPFAPYGFSGISTGAASVFLAYAGFDSLAASAEECKNPKKDMVYGILGSIIISTIIYVILAGALTGMVPFTELNNAKPLSHALSLKGNNFGVLIVSIGGIAGMTSVMIVYLFAQPRIFMAMSRDKLLPSFFAKIHKKHRTPYIGTLVTGFFIAMISGFVPINILSDISSMGILMIFLLACVIVMILRYKMPNLERPFRCPALYIISPVAIIMCAYLILKLVPMVGKYMLIWISFSFLFYYLYSFKKRSKNSISND